MHPAAAIHVGLYSFGVLATEIAYASNPDYAWNSASNGLSWWTCVLLVIWPVAALLEHRRLGDPLGKNTWWIMQSRFTRKSIQRIGESTYVTRVAERGPYLQLAFGVIAFATLIRNLTLFAYSVPLSQWGAFGHPAWSAVFALAAPYVIKAVYSADDWPLRPIVRRLFDKG